MCENCFPIVFLWRWKSKDSVVLNFKRFEHRYDTSIVNGKQKVVKCQLSFVMKDPVKKVPHLVAGWSYVTVLVVQMVWKVCWILKGFWLCPSFCWVMDLWYECEVFLLFHSVGCCCLCLLLWNLLSSVFGVFCRDVVVSNCTGGFISMVWNCFFEGPIGFTDVFWSSHQLMNQGWRGN